MDFKSLMQNKMLMPGILVLVVVAVFFLKSLIKSDSAEPNNSVATNSEQILPINGAAVKEPPVNNLPIAQNQAQPTTVADSQEDLQIQEQLDRDRQQQKLTKDLKNKLEQTNLELEQEKALSEINKLKKENIGSFNDTSGDGQNNLPEIKVEYIGGDTSKKEAILTIGSTSYQVKVKSSPTENIQVVSISDTSVTVHFSAPQELTKTIEYKPE